MEKRSQPVTDREVVKIYRIAKTAARLFHKKGYLETSLGDIAAAAKISKGALYYYFSSKHEILYHILENYMEAYMKDLKETLDGIDDHFSKIRFIVSHHVEFYNNNPFESKLLIDEAHHLPVEFHKTIIQKEIDYYHYLAGLLSEVLGKGVKKDKLTVTTFCLFGMCNWLYHWYNSEGPISTSELSEIIYKIFTVGILGLDSVNKPDSLPLRHIVSAQVNERTGGCLRRGCQRRRRTK